MSSDATRLDSAAISLTALGDSAIELRYLNRIHPHLAGFLRSHGVVVPDAIESDVVPALIVTCPPQLDALRLLLIKYLDTPTNELSRNAVYALQRTAPDLSEHRL